MTKRLLQVAAILILSLCLAQTAHAQSVLVVAAGQVYTVSANATYTGIVVNAGGELRFDPSHSVTITSTANVIISGTLTLHPASAAYADTLRFTGINEANFVGGGLVPLASDVGLWVVGGGKLDIAGSAKTAWTHAAGSIAAGASTITVLDATGWRVGDEISIAPTELPAVGNPAWNGFDLRTITAISGTVVTLNAPTTRAHPININPFNGAIYSVEILNLTRNVRIEGTGDGGPSYTTNHRAHVFVHSTQAQSIRYAALRYLGPRMADGAYTQDILGRYGLHFHLNGDGSRGSLVEGVVVRDSGAHAFVPHASNGITFRDTIAYNTFDDAYWWDKPPCSICPTEHDNDTNDLLYDHTVAAMIRTDPASRGFRLSGYLLHGGTNLTIQNSVGVGIQGNTDAAAFDWPEGGIAVWDFDTGNIAHNNRVDGIFVWQNTTLDHVVSNFVAYNNTGVGIDHGAYKNKYQYFDSDLFGNKIAGISSRAQNAASAVPRPDGYGLAFERLRMAGIFAIDGHNQGAASPVLVKDCILGGVSVNEGANSEAGWYDFVNCTKTGGAALAPADFTFVKVNAGSLYRVQNGATAWQLAADGVVTTIAPFYLYLSDLAQQVKGILDANPSVRQELLNAGVIH